MINQKEISKANSNSQKKQLILLSIYLLPLIILLLYIYSFSVNLPWADDWSLLSLFEKIHTNSVSFNDFYSQHNEHRMLFPRILFSFFAFATNWNIQYQLIFSVILVVIQFLILYKISEHNSSYLINKKRKININISSILTCFLIFSIIQWENWLWGFQIAWYLINTCLIIVIYILGFSKFENKFKLLVSSLICFTASFSSAHGLLLWPALIPSVLSIKGNLYDRVTRLMIWLGLFIICLKLYLMGYSKPSHHPDLWLFINQPLPVIKYLLTIISFPISGKDSTLFMGLIILSIFLLLTFFYCKVLFLSISTVNKEEFFSLASISAWFSLGLYSFSFSALTTIGRSGFGIEQAASSRYTTNSILLLIAILNLLDLYILSKNHFVKYKFKYKKIRSYIPYRIKFFVSIPTIYSLIFSMTLIIFFCFASFNFLGLSVLSINQGHNSLSWRRTGKDCLELIHYLNNSIENHQYNCLNGIYPSATVSMIQDFANRLERIKFYDFPKNISFNTTPTETYGFLDTTFSEKNPLVVKKDEVITLSGWAILPQERRTADTVLLSYGNNESFFATGLVNKKRVDIVEAYKSRNYKYSGWSISFSASSLPSGTTVVKPWVYDPPNEQFVRLVNEISIKVEE